MNNPIQVELVIMRKSLDVMLSCQLVHLANHEERQVMQSLLTIADNIDLIAEVVEH